MPKRPLARPRVALLIETSNRYGRDLLQGIHDWIRASGLRWSIRLTEQARGAALPEWLAKWEGDGVIARVDTANIASALRRTGLPVVDVSAERRESEFPRVSIDNTAVARLAFTHLQQRRLRHFAYCGDERYLWSQLRGRAFAAFIREAGHECREFREPTRAGNNWEQQTRAIVAWLTTLPKPVGLLACYDSRAQQVLEACERAKFSVPEDIAVLGIDNDELICELCDPPLSSILPNARRTGYEAAAILSRAMNKRSAKSRPSLEIEPVRVVERRSTDAVAVADEHVAAALRYIRDHANIGIRVKEVLRAIPVSRTLLERKFIRELGESPHRVIKRQQIEHVRQLLAESDLPIARIADMTGFDSPSYLSTAFKNETGRSPRAYRAKFRN